MPQGEQCPFCQLVANPEQTFDVHESEHFKAWLDINPRARGHTMVVPKDHVQTLEGLGELVNEFFDVIRVVAEKARNGLDADGVSVVLNDGETAGQRLDHIYAQVFPRYAGEENEGAPAGAVFQPMEDVDESALEEWSAAMQDAGFQEFADSIEGPATEHVKENKGHVEDDEGEQDDEGRTDRDGDSAVFR